METPEQATYESAYTLVVAVDGHLTADDNRLGAVPTVLYYDRGKLLDTLDQVVRAILTDTLEIGTGP